MRIIAVKTLKDAWIKHASAKQSLLSWYEEVEQTQWKNPQELKVQFRNASVIN